MDDLKVNSVFGMTNENQLIKKGPEAELWF